MVNIGSMYSLFGPPASVNYAAAKSGILGLMRALAVELGAKSIQVNAILPGWIEMEMTRARSFADPVANESVRSKTPAGRWGQPNDLAGAVVFLASRASEFITGVALPVDGGYAVTDRPLSSWRFRKDGSTGESALPRRP